MTLVSGFSARIVSSVGEALADAVGIGRQAEVERHHRRLVRAQQVDRAASRSERDQHFIIVIGPAQLALQPFVVLDDQQLGLGLGSSCAHPFKLGRGGRRSAPGKKIVKRVPSPSRLSTSSRPPIAVTKARASKAPMPKPPSLVEAKGWNRRVRMNSADMPTPLSMISIATSPRALEAQIRTGASGSAGVDRVLDEMDQGLLEPDRVGQARQAGLADNARPDGCGSWPRRPRSTIGSSAASRSGSVSRRVAARQAGEQVVHLAHRALQRRDHVGAELGIVGVALGIARDQAELAHQILDVVHDEGEAAVELVEAVGVGERLLAARFGEIARRLDAGGAEQVEILPVERPPHKRMARG